MAQVRIRMAVTFLSGCVFAASLAYPGFAPADDAPSALGASDQFEVVPLRGRVVWMAEALKRRFAIESDPDTAEQQVALETTDGQVLPIVKDARGRGFWLDERIRGRDVELLVRRYRGTPALKVIRVYAIEAGDVKYELDYWCDICSIPMYELKPCECCQGETRIRLRKVGEEVQP